MRTEISTVAQTVQNNLIEKISREEAWQKTNSIFSYLSASHPWCSYLNSDGSGRATFIMVAEIEGFDLDGKKSPSWL